MVLLGYSDVAEYVGESRQRIRNWHKRGKMPEPTAYTYKYKYPLWTEEQIKTWGRGLWEWRTYNEK